MSEKIGSLSCARVRGFIASAPGRKVCHKFSLKIPKRVFTPPAKIRNSPVGKVFTQVAKPVAALVKPIAKLQIKDILPAAATVAGLGILKGPLAKVFGPRDAGDASDRRDLTLPGTAYGEPSSPEASPSLPVAMPVLAAAPVSVAPHAPEPEAPFAEFQIPTVSTPVMYGLIAGGALLIFMLARRK